ncbi:MAG: hypothetical protein ACTHQQ_17125 [Solirubrobacteraceae bacterium]
MPKPLTNQAIRHVSHRIPGLRQIPAATLLEIAEVVLLAREHLKKLEPDERRRVVALVRAGRGRRRNLSPREQVELAALVAKAEPRLFFGLAAEQLSPLPLPRRVVYGPPKGRKGPVSAAWRRIRD